MRRVRKKTKKSRRVKRPIMLSAILKELDKARRASTPRPVPGFWELVVGKPDPSVLIVWSQGWWRRLLLGRFS
jgi:hypothetical protein